MQVSTLAGIITELALLGHPQLLHNFLISWVPSCSRRKSLKGDLKGRESSANLAQMCQPWARAMADTPQSAGCWKSPFLFLSCPVTGTHLQPAWATPREAALPPARSLCSASEASSNYFPLLPHPSCLGDPTSSYSLQPTTKNSTVQQRPNELQCCSEDVHSSHEAVERPWGFPPAYLSLCT